MNISGHIISSIFLKGNDYFQNFFIDYLTKTILKMEQLRNISYLLMRCPVKKL